VSVCITTSSTKVSPSTRILLGFTGTTERLEYCRLHNITVQAWAPWPRGVVEARPRNSGVSTSGDEETRDRDLGKIQRYARGHSRGVGAPPSGKHAGSSRTTKPDRIREQVKGAEVKLTREEWYSLYLAGRGGAIP